MGYSYSGKVLAVRRVTENSGKKTPGVDREVWDTPEKEIQGAIILGPFDASISRNRTARLCARSEAGKKIGPASRQRDAGRAKARGVFGLER